ncbi:MAG: hypothetical protein WA958_06290 [Tunicatimonas sp.]
MKNDQKNLKDALRQLPDHRPHPDTWEAIERALTPEAPLRRALAQLPEHEPPADAWPRVARALVAHQRPAPRQWLHYAAAAGAIVLLSVAVLLLKYNHPADDDAVLTYSEELAPPAVAPVSDDALEEEAQEYLQQLCRQAPATTCEQPEFIALQKHLQELTEEERALQQAMQKLGYDPQLVKYQVRIENLKSKATRELIQLVIS